ncbi:Eukaryotic translation initiation factor 3 subunit F [Hondaea fermentalgiana]|uniref:COP9 signalosome complex subunit 6 n=1 Tax=Hondaea fermentalgiana TaxID=2315210 RepID=A0A2R5GVH1_9STRA|nr:Eukaryotic translation initiation factor 3 subunit F [Hondaea fermentalgiana]|eukprot:GBG34846.1 Eukaryotic translation initiation factor 3 subunit F [Hondaea fermentalgiana]
MGEASRKAALSLHPDTQLVLVNVSDHYTRQQLSGQSGQRTIGMLFGCQTGLSVHVYDSFEMPYSRDENTGEVQLDAEFIRQKKEHFEAVFPQYEILGWYTVGGDVSQEDMAIHRAMSAFNESPLLLLVDPNISPDSKELPIKVVEAVMQVIEEVPTMIFVDMEFQIDTVEPERITIDHIVKGGGARSARESSLVPSLEDLVNAVQMIAKRMRILESYVRKTRSGELPKNHAILREIAAVSQHLPVLQMDAFDQSFRTELDDAQLVTYLAMLTKASAAISDVQSKVSLLTAAQRVGVPASKRSVMP